MKLCPPIYTWSSTRFIVTKFLSFHWQQKSDQNHKNFSAFASFQTYIHCCTWLSAKKCFLCCRVWNLYVPYWVLKTLQMSWGVWWSLALHLLGSAYFFQASFGDRIGDLFYFSYVFIAYYMMGWCSGYQIPWLFYL